MVRSSPSFESGVSESPKSRNLRSLRSWFWLWLKVEYLASATLISAGVALAPVAEIDVSEAKTPNSPSSDCSEPAGTNQPEALGHRGSSLISAPIQTGQYSN